MGLDTLFKILQVFDLKMGEFFGETDSPAEKEARDLAGEIKDLSDHARQEVREFVRFKKQLENAEANTDAESDSVSGDTEEEKP